MKPDKVNSKKIVPKTVDLNLSNLDGKDQQLTVIEEESAATRKQVNKKKEGKKQNFKAINFKIIGSAGQKSPSSTQFKSRSECVSAKRKKATQEGSHRALKYVLIVIFFLSILGGIISILAWCYAKLEEEQQLRYKSVLFEHTIYDDFLLGTQYIKGTLPVTRFYVIFFIIQVCTSIFGIFGIVQVFDNSNTVIFQIYFYLSVMFIMLFAPYSIGIIINPQNILGSNINELSGIYIKFVAWISLFVIVFIIFSLISIIRIITLFKLSCSLLMTFPLILSIVSVVGIYVLLKFFDSSQFIFSKELHSNYVDIIKLKHTLYALIGLACLQIVSSFIGIISAFTKDRFKLKIFLYLSLLIEVILIGLMLLVAFVDIEKMVLNNCRLILKLSSYKWWHNSVGCQKYTGAESGNLVEAKSLQRGYYFAIGNVGSKVRCHNIDDSVVAWEYKDVSPPFQGCLNYQCCNQLVMKLSSSRLPLLVGLFTFSAILAFCIVFSRWILHKFSVKKDGVTALNRRLYPLVLFIISIIVLSVCFLIGQHVSSTVNLVTENDILEISNITFDTGHVNGFVSSICLNNIKDSDESDIDCGGSCIGCSYGRSCNRDMDCLSHFCSLGKCSTDLNLTCSNLRKDVHETDTDCGWVACKKPCAIGKSCFGNIDCVSNLCSEAGVCISCSDGINNGKESDIDCGSSYCSLVKMDSEGSLNAGLCSDGKKCFWNANCQSNLCQGEICVSCTNEVLDGLETDIDCGGSCNKKCLTGQNCLVNSDCLSDFCQDLKCALNNALSYCYAHNGTNLDLNCSDGLHSKFETSIDCGGYFCQRQGKYCNDRDICEKGNDCVSSDCYNGICVSCFNSFIDGSESDVDCGGLCDIKCGVAQQCLTDSDCNGTLRCRTAEYVEEWKLNSDGIFMSNTSVCAFPLANLEVTRDHPIVIFDKSSMSLLNEILHIQAKYPKSDSVSLSSWPFPCEVDLKVTVFGYNLMVSYDLNNNFFSTTDQKNLWVTLNYNAKIPSINLVPSCINTLETGSEYLSIEFSPSTYCAPLVVFNEEDLKQAIDIVVRKTRVQLVTARLKDSSCLNLKNCEAVAIPAVRVRAWSYVNRTCKVRSDLENHYHCSKVCGEITTLADCLQETTCCQTFATSSCLSETLTMDIVTTTSSHEGRVSISWTEIFPIDNSILYPISLLLSTDKYQAQIVSILVKNGEVHDAGTIFLLEQKEHNLNSSCSCESYEDDIISGKSTYCKLPGEYKCFSVPPSGVCVDRNPYYILCYTGVENYKENDEINIIPISLPTPFPTRTPSALSDTFCTSEIDSVTDEQCTKLGCPTGLCILRVNRYYNYSSNCNGEWITVFSQINCYTQVDVGDVYFNSLIKPGTIIRYDIRDEPYLFYKRISPLVDGNDLYTAFLDSFAEETDKLNIDFELFGREADLAADVNRWEHCQSNIPGHVGFPGYCGKSSVVADKWIQAFCPDLEERGIRDYSLHICNTATVDSQNSGDGESEDVVSLSGVLTNVETHDGLLANVYLYKGIYRQRLLSHDFAYKKATVNIQTSVLSSEQIYKHGCGVSQIPTLSDGTEYLEPTTFNFGNVTQGVYTIVVEYSRQIAESYVFDKHATWIPLIDNPYLDYNEYFEDHIHSSIQTSWAGIKVVFSLVLRNAPNHSTTRNIFALGDDPGFALFAGLLSNAQGQQLLSITMFINTPTEKSCQFDTPNIFTSEETTFEIVYYPTSTTFVVKAGSIEICREILNYSPLYSPNLRVWTTAPGYRSSLSYLRYLQIYEFKEISTDFVTIYESYNIQSDTVMTIEVSPRIPLYEARISLKYLKVDNLDLVLHFGNDEKECIIGSTLMQDASSQCGEAYVIRKDRDYRLEYKIDIIGVRTIHPVTYRVYIARSSVRPENVDGELWRSDGRCGKHYPLESGAISRCPTTPFTWPDGSLETRPCCSSMGFCSSNVKECTCRFCVNYLDFLNPDWENSYRMDGLCRLEAYPSDSGSVAHCPVSKVEWSDTFSESESRPCCNEFGRCSAPSLSSCSCDNCFDYRELSGESVEGQIVEGSEHPTEISEAIVSLSTRFRKVDFTLPAVFDAQAYDSGIPYPGSRTDDSTYARMFCFILDDKNNIIHEYSNPRFFKFQDKMKSLSRSCPSHYFCEILGLSGFSKPYLFDDDILNGEYIKRFSSEISYSIYKLVSFVSINTQGCMIQLNDVSSFEVGDKGYKICFEYCELSSTCNGVYLNMLNSRCYFIGNISECGPLVSMSEAYFYEKAMTSESHVWYTSKATLFQSRNERVHMYSRQLEGRTAWLLDSDVNFFNGYYSIGIDWNGGGTSPMNVDQWYTEGQFQQQTEDLSQITFSRRNVACDAATELPVSSEWLDEVGCDCTVTGRGMCQESELITCAPFILRFEETGWCIERVDDQLEVRECLPHQSMSQEWYYNRQVGALEGLGSSRSVRKVVDVLDHSQSQFFIVSNPSSLFEVFVSSLESTTLCATENGICDCIGTVYFGDASLSFPELHQSGGFSVLVSAGPIGCDPMNMLLDPAPGKEKRCWCVSQRENIELLTVLFSEEIGYSNVLLLKQGLNEYCFSKNPALGFSPVLIAFTNPMDCASFYLF